MKCSVAQTGFGFVWHVRDGDRVSYIRVYKFKNILCYSGLEQDGTLMGTVTNKENSSYSRFPTTNLVGKRSEVVNIDCQQVVQEIELLGQDRTFI